MAGRLATVPEESIYGSAVAYPGRGVYRDSIRRVAVSRVQIRSSIFSHSQSGHNGSSYSSDSGPSNNSACSSGSAVAATAADFVNQELKTIAGRMLRDGFTQSVVQAMEVAFGSSGRTSLDVKNCASNLVSPVPALEYRDGADSVLESWFFELDVAWVLQIRQEHGSQWQLRLQDNSGSSLQDLVERWIRGLIVIVHSMTELVFIRHEITAVARFGEASIFKMLMFVDAIVSDFKAENLQAVLDMYICVCIAMNNMANSQLCSKYRDLKVMLLSLSKSVFKLSDAIPSTMEKVRTLIEDDDSWDIEIPRAGEVHRNTRWIVECIISLGEAEARSYYTRFSDLRVERDDTILYLKDLRVDTIRYLKDLLIRKSELCSDPSLRYLFLLNNSYFVAKMIEPCQSENDWYLTPECKEYMDSYLDVSWGHCWINTSSVAKFESAFNRTHQAQKFWKVPDPRLRDALRTAITKRVLSRYRISSLRETITKTVICGYSVYLKKHPRLEKHSSAGSISPDILKEMLGQLFEG